MQLTEKFVLGLLCLTAILGFSTAGADAQKLTPQGVFTPSECMFDYFGIVPENPSIECGYLTVPEDHNNPEGPTIELAVVILKSRSENPYPDPIFFAQGGPGGSTIDTYTKLLPPDNLFQENRDLVLWDQRGTLYSIPDLRCEEFFNLTVETLNTILSSEEEAELVLDTAGACRNRLNNLGANLSNYDSLQNAADIEALRKALGYDQINFYGVSYGSLLGLHLLDNYPENIRSAVLDAVVPSQTNFVLNAAQTMNRTFEALFQQCLNDPGCNAAYPDLENVFYGVVDSLNENPAEILVTDSETGISYPALIDGDFFLNVIFQLFYPSEYIPFIPRLIFDARDGDFSILSKVILPLIIFDRTISDGMYFSVICAEDADYDPAQANLDDLPEQIARNERVDLALFLDLCGVWDVDQLPPEIDAPVESAVPTLLLSGYFDPITPPVYAEQAAETLTNNVNLVFPAGGHGQIPNGPCENRIMLEFLDNPNQTPDTSCITPELDIILPGDILEFPTLDFLFSSDLAELASSLIWIILAGSSSLFLLSSGLIYPLVWLIRRSRKPAQDEFPSETNLAEDLGSNQKSLQKFGPWAAFVAGILLLIFLGIFAYAAVRLVLANNPIIFYGFPIETWPLFILPFLFLSLGILMLIIVWQKWRNLDGTIWGRIYYSLLTLSALAGITALSQLGVYGVFF